MSPFHPDAGFRNGRQAQTRPDPQGPSSSSSGLSTSLGHVLPCFTRLRQAHLSSFSRPSSRCARACVSPRAAFPLPPVHEASSADCPFPPSRTWVSVLGLGSSFPESCVSLSLTTCFRVSLLPQPRAVPPAPVSLRAPLLSPLPVGAQVPWPLSPPATSRCCGKRVRAAFPFPWGFSAVCLHLPNASRSQVSLSSLFSSWPFASGFSRCLLNVH